MKKFIKRFSVIILCCMCFFSSTVYGVTYRLQKWHLVDSGKHLDWDGSSKYMDEWYNSVNTWNAYKKGVIRVDRWDTIEDVEISDKKVGDGTACAETRSGGKIVFYKNAMDKLSFIQRQSVATHEIGHALGIGHNEDNFRSVMRPIISPEMMEKGIADLDLADELAYDAAYRTY